VGPIVPISARTADGIAPLVEAIRTYLPEQPAEFSADEFTDRSVRFLCAEFLREQVFLQTREEVPYGVAVEIEKFEDLADLTHVQAVVHVEKPAQRAILIGKAGARMKELATAARAQMEELLGRKVFLEVHVRIEPKWSERIEMLKQFGYIL
jgi:GTP-binding protein Era